VVFVLDFWGFIKWLLAYGLIARTVFLQKGWSPLQPPASSAFWSLNPLPCFDCHGPNKCPYFTALIPRRVG